MTTPVTRCFGHARGVLAGLMAAFVAVAVLSGCATPTPYKPSGEDSRTGYNEQRLGPNRYRVWFSGNSATPRETVENYLLYRSSELALQNGFTHFVFASQDTEVKTYYRETFDHWPGYGFYWHTWPWGHRSAFGGSFSSGTARPVTSYTAYADVVLLSAEQARDEPMAFDARMVQETIGPSIRTPSDR
jgi:hypothetical protein